MCVSLGSIILPCSDQLPGRSWDMQYNTVQCYKRAPMDNATELSLGISTDCSSFVPWPAFPTHASRSLLLHASPGDSYLPFHSTCVSPLQCSWIYESIIRFGVAWVAIIVLRRDRVHTSISAFINHTYWEPLQFNCCNLQYCKHLQSHINKDTWYSMVHRLIPSLLPTLVSHTVQRAGEKPWNKATD